MGLEEQQFKHILKQFPLEGHILSCDSFGSGHIHDTYLVTQSTGQRYILQRFNHLVFTEPQKVMENLQMVLNHLQMKDGNEDSAMQNLSLVQTISRNPLWHDSQGGYWRLFDYVENSFAIDKVEAPEQACEGALAFGHFLAQLLDLPATKLHITIKDFHHVGRRFEQLREAVTKDVQNRAASVKMLTDFALERQEQVSYLSTLIDGNQLPLRVTHNDTKINNILFHTETQKGLCVVDLDTVMPGLLMYDFGDMARTFCPEGGEEDQTINFRMEIFDQMCQGFFLNDFKDMITTQEKDSLRWGPWLMSYLMGVRFLADYINGDLYYKISYPMHNLDRANNQLLLVKEIEEHSDQIESCIQNSLL